MAKEIDPKKLNAFSSKMGDTLNAASAALMISIGHKVCLFDTMASMGAGSVTQIATAASLDARYVREWLAAMTTAQIVEYDSRRDLYALPIEHAAMLTRDAGTSNIALYMQYLPLLAKVEDKIVDRFHQGGGIPYDEYETFHSVMAEVSGARFDSLLVKKVLPSVPKLIERLEDGINVADIGCGSGHAVNTMAKAFPKSRFTGIDFSDDALDVGRKEAASSGLENTAFFAQDAATLDGSVQYDFITTFDAVHDQARPREMVAGVFASLAPGNYWLCADLCASSHLGENLDHPIGTFGYTISCMHCMSVSLAYDGEGLGAMWGAQQARAIFTTAGFDVVDVARIEGDASNNYYLCQRPA